MPLFLTHLQFPPGKPGDLQRECNEMGGMCRVKSRADKAPGRGLLEQTVRSAVHAVRWLVGWFIYSQPLATTTSTSASRLISASGAPTLPEAARWMARHTLRWKAGSMLAELPGNCVMGARGLPC